MNIGCLGWGSLIWNPDTLPVRSGWYQDGPLLPVEFARHSSEDRVTLVLVPTVPSVRTLWCLLAVTDLQTARDELAARESVLKTKERNIGFWSRTSGASGMFAEVIGNWAAGHQLDAVVWTSLGPKWQHVEGRVPSADDVLNFVRPQGPDSKAAEYIRKTPEQVDTEYRHRMISEIDWLRPRATTEEAKMATLDESRKLNSDVLIKRIDHTLSFTFTITKLMYLVNGAGLAFIYFAFNKGSGLANPKTIGFIVAVALATLNLIHANFIQNQHIWYRVDSKALDDAIGANGGQRDSSYHDERNRSWRTKLSPIKSAHGTFWWFHVATALALLVLGVVLLYA